MNKLMLTTAAALGALALSGTAHAGNAEGKLQVKLLATGVLPDGKVDTGSPSTGLTGLDTKANDNVVPTVAIEYFFTPNVSAETICCFTGHHVSVVSPTATVYEHAIDHVLVLPATLTLKYHLPLGVVKPYVGAGVTEFFFIDERRGSDLPSTITQAKLEDTFGAVLQAGVDVAINDKGLSVSLDAKRYFVRPRSHFYAGTTEVITAKHKLDPWVVSGGIAYRF